MMVGGGVVVGCINSLSKKFYGGKKKNKVQQNHNFPGFVAILFVHRKFIMCLFIFEGINNV
jgi:hypothetical protein